MTTKPIGNLWRATSTIGVETPSLTADATADLVIIGGGFTGNAAALEAARRGASVVLLEAETFGHGGSGRNVGLVNAGLWLPPHDVMAKMGREAGMKLVGLLAEAPQLVWTLIDREEIDCEATPNGTLHLAHSPGGLRNLVERHRQGVELGAPLQLLDAEETARRTGSRAFHGSLFDPRAGTIQPLAYLRGCDSLLDDAECADYRLRLLFPTDFEIAQGALGLRTPVSGVIDLHGAKGICFGSGRIGLTHRCLS